MQTPLCFCNGVIRSGSTWSFNVCRGLYQELARSLNKPFGSAYLDGPFVEQFVARDWNTAPGPTVIKAHMIGAAALGVIRSGHAKAVCTFRDPRDCLASDLVFINGGMDQSLKRLVASLEFLKFYQSTPHILLVKYEEMMADRLGQIRRIAAHLGVRCDETAIHRIDARTNIHSSRKLCQDLQNRPEDRVLNIASHRVDPETHLHENHIGRATPGRWKDEFTAEQGRWLTEYFSPWLLQLGYETPQSLREYLGKADLATLPPTAPMAAGSMAARPGSFTIEMGLMQSRAS